MYSVSYLQVAALLSVGALAAPKAAVEVSTVPIPPPHINRSRSQTLMTDRPSNHNIIGACTLAEGDTSPTQSM